MKKSIFIILVTILLILVLFYLYDQREKTLNKEIHNSNDIHIEYPYFNHFVIDDYIDQYIRHHIHRQKKLFIDYDYRETKEKLDLTMYIFEQQNHIVNEKKRHLTFNFHTNQLNILKEKEQNIEYDIYLQKKIDRSKPLVALTFDDGPNHNTIKVLKILEKYQVRATFFVLGTNIEGNEKIIEKMKELNMEIGNHMYSHQLTTQLNQTQIKEEILATDEKIKNITGKVPTLIRPSYGIYHAALKKQATRPIIMWNLDTLDWKYHNSQRIYQSVMNHVKDGSIILMHDIYNATANSLELMIPKLLKDGYQLVTVSELLYGKERDNSDGKVYYHG